MKKILNLWKTSDRLILLPVLASGISVIVIITLFFLIQNSLPQKLPLFYSLSWGQAQLSAKQQFLLLPVILMLVTLVNTLIALQLHPVQLVLRRILTVTLIFINAIISITALKILFIFI